MECGSLLSLRRGNSADFTLDTRPNFRFARFADSTDFVLDTPQPSKGLKP
jgi:hypothetical protein